jgi:hypothetical protein
VIGSAEGIPIMTARDAVMHKFSEGRSFKSHFIASLRSVDLFL